MILSGKRWGRRRRPAASPSLSSSSSPWERRRGVRTFANPPLQRRDTSDLDIGLARPTAVRIVTFSHVTNVLRCAMLAWPGAGSERSLAVWAGAGTRPAALFSRTSARCLNCRMMWTSAWCLNCRMMWTSERCLNCRMMWTFAWCLNSAGPVPAAAALFSRMWTSARCLNSRMV